MKMAPVVGEDQSKVKELLTQAVTLLCKSSLTYNSEVEIEGLLGITLDKSQVLLINIKENIQSLKSTLASGKENEPGKPSTPQRRRSTEKRKRSPEKSKPVHIEDDSSNEDGHSQEYNPASEREIKSLPGNQSEKDGWEGTGSYVKKESRKSCDYETPRKRSNIVSETYDTGDLDMTVETERKPLVFESYSQNNQPEDDSNLTDNSAAHSSSFDPAQVKKEHVEDEAEDDCFMVADDSSGVQHMSDMTQGDWTAANDLSSFYPHMAQSALASSADLNSLVHATLSQPPSSGDQSTFGPNVLPLESTTCGPSQLSKLSTNDSLAGNIMVGISVPSFEPSFNPRMSKAEPYMHTNEQKQDSQKRHVCRHCFKTFSFRHGLKRHIDTAHSAVKVVFNCTYCDAKFSRKDTLARHKNLVHSAGEMQSQQENPAFIMLENLGLETSSSK